MWIWSWMRLKKESVYSVYKVLFDIVYYVEMVVVSIVLADFSLSEILEIYIPYEYARNRVS